MSKLEEIRNKLEDISSQRSEQVLDPDIDVFLGDDFGTNPSLRNELKQIGAEVGYSSVKIRGGFNKASANFRVWFTGLVQVDPPADNETVKEKIDEIPLFQDLDYRVDSEEEDSIIFEITIL